MKVYRYVSEDELKCILNENISEIGHSFDKNKIACNNHKYKQGVKYLHFFSSKSSIEYFKKLNYTNGVHYICEFNIPLKVLIKGIGKGYYDIGGMDFITIPQREFIVPVSEFRKEWLKSYIKDVYYSEKNSISK